MVITLLTIQAGSGIIDMPQDRSSIGYFDYELMSAGHICTLIIPMSARHNLFTSLISNEVLGAKLMCWLDSCILSSLSQVNRG